MNLFYFALDMYYFEKGTPAKCCHMITGKRCLFKLFSISSQTQIAKKTIGSLDSTVEFYANPRLDFHLPKCLCIIKSLRLGSKSIRADGGS